MIQRLSELERSWFNSVHGVTSTTPLSQVRREFFKSIGITGFSDGELEDNFLKRVISDFGATSTSNYNADLWREAVSAIGATPVRTKTGNQAIFYSNPVSKLGYALQGMSGLVAYYPMNELSGDTINRSPATKGSYNGTATGVTYGVAGQAGNAYTFDGTDKIAVTTDAALDSSTAMSVAILLNVNGNGGGGFGRVVQKGPNAVGYWDIFTQGGGQIQLNADFATQDLVCRINITFGQWYLLVFTYTGGTTAATDVGAYLNGAVQGHVLNQDGTGGRTADSSNLTIGNRTSDTARTFDGKAQHLAIFNRVITDAEILKLAQAAGLA